MPRIMPKHTATISHGIVTTPIGINPGLSVQTHRNRFPTYLQVVICQSLPQDQNPSHRSIVPHIDLNLPYPCFGIPRRPTLEGAEARTRKQESASVSINQRRVKCLIVPCLRILGLMRRLCDPSVRTGYYV